MKKLDIAITLQESFYENCGSPILPIPFSSEDMKELTTNGLSMLSVADNLLQMIDQHPDRIPAYKSLLVYSCLAAGAFADSQGNHEKTHLYFLLASDFAPDDAVVRQNLAVSFQKLKKYKEAIDNFLFVLQNADSRTDGLFESTVRLIECYYLFGEKESAALFAAQLSHNIFSLPEEEQKDPVMTIMRILTKDRVEKELWGYFFNDAT